MNVEPVWMQGITGDGVIVGIVDDGMILNIHNILESNKLNRNTKEHNTSIASIPGLPACVHKKLCSRKIEPTFANFHTSFQ